MANSLRLVSEIFYKVQNSTLNHVRLQSLLKKLYTESNFEDFLQEFENCLKIVFMEDHSVKNSFVEKTLQFCVLFCTSLKPSDSELEETCPFLAAVINRSLQFSDVRGARVGVCKFINLLLKHLGEQESYLDEDICDHIRDVMLERINDIKPAVRVQAVEILHRFQDPRDLNDVVVKNFVECIHFESSAQVRRAVVQNICVNEATIPLILGRCLDVDEIVRLSAFKKFSKFPFKVLQLEHRQYILRNGFKNQNDKVQSFITKTLLPQWLSKCNGNYFQLIDALKLDADEVDFRQTTDIVEKSLNVFFRNGKLTEVLEALPLDADKLIRNGGIVWEEIIFWRCLVQFLRKESDDNTEKILPELSTFCKYISKVYKTRSNCKNDWEIVQHDHIILELLKICEGYDFTDEVGRQELKKIITDILTDALISHENISLLVEIFGQLVSNITERTTEICAIIADIREPLVTQSISTEQERKLNVKNADIRYQLNIARDDQEMAIEAKDYGRAQDLKLKIADLENSLQQIAADLQKGVKTKVSRNDPVTLSVCLDILNATLMAKDITTFPDAFRFIQEQFVQPLIVSDRPEISCRAIKFLGLCCTVNKIMAQKSMKLFCLSLLTPTRSEETILTAISCVTDLLIIYGPNILEFEIDITQNTTNIAEKSSRRRQLFCDSQFDETVCSLPLEPTFQNVIQTLTDLLDDDSSEIQEKSCEALIKLLCTGIVRSSLLFSRLLIKWFNPATAKDVRTRQLLAQMFTEYAANISDSSKVIEQAFVPTLATIIDVPSNSPLTDIDIDSVLRFLTEICRPGRHINNTGLDTHKNIALLLCREICDHPESKHCAVYVKALLHLDPPYKDPVALRDIQKQVDTMLELLQNKMAYKYVKRYKYKIDPVETNVTTETATNIDEESKTADTTPAINITEEETNDTQPSVSVNENETVQRSKRKSRRKSNTGPELNSKSTTSTERRQLKSSSGTNAVLNTRKKETNENHQSDSKSWNENLPVKRKKKRGRNSDLVVDDSPKSNHKGSTNTEKRQLRSSTGSTVTNNQEKANKKCPKAPSSNENLPVKRRKNGNRISNSALEQSSESNNRNYNVHSERRQLRSSAQIGLVSNTDSDHKPAKNKANAVTSKKTATKRRK